VHRVQLLLAAFFGMAGAAEVSQPMSALIQQFHWPAAVPEPLVRFIGLSELLGATALILPSLTRIKPRPTALAASGLVVVMVLARLFHLSRGEAVVLPVPLVLGALAAFVAWGRWKKGAARGPLTRVRRRKSAAVAQRRERGPAQASRSAKVSSRRLSCSVTGHRILAWTCQLLPRCYPE
jgi:putative oxidoreductase